MEQEKQAVLQSSHPIRIAENSQASYLEKGQGSQATYHNRNGLLLVCRSLPTEQTAWTNALRDFFRSCSVIYNRNKGSASFTALLNLGLIEVVRNYKVGREGRRYQPIRLETDREKDGTIVILNALVPKSKPKPQPKPKPQEQQQARADDMASPFDGADVPIQSTATNPFEGIPRDGSNIRDDD